MVEKEKKEASDEGHEAPASPVLENEIPKVKSFKKRSRNFVEVMMKKNPCSLASATSVVVIGPPGLGL